MKKLNIPKIKLPKITAKTLIGLFALAVCLKGCSSCYRIQVQKNKAQEALDKKTPATLIGKNIAPGCTYYNRDISLLFDTDGNPQTVEAVLDVSNIKTEKAIPFYNVTNGTTKTVYEWKRMVPRYESSTWSK